MPKKSKHPPQKKMAATHILTFLENTDEWLSGEDLACRLGVSRAAIAKQMARLREAGHVIASATNRGYRLLIRAEKISREQVLPHLTAGRLGRGEWRSFDATSSTNTETVAWALDGGPEGAVVTAERQTRGRGRKGNDWFSSPRSVQASILLRPRGGDAETARVTHAALTAMAEAIRELLPLSPRIKLPNDLFIEDRKVAGVLVESGRRGDEPDWVVMGIGCNVNALPEDFPGGLGETVTSLYALSGTAVSRNILLAKFLSRFEQLYSG